MPAKRKPQSKAPRPPQSDEKQLFAVAPPLEPIEASMTIVGVGASAGGLEAFSALLQSLPKNPGVAIVFVQHLAPQHESALVPLLSGQSALPVIQATEGLEVEPNHIYVIPPNAQMVITDNTLHVNARP